MTDREINIGDKFYTMSMFGTAIVQCVVREVITSKTVNEDEHTTGLDGIPIKVKQNIDYTDAQGNTRTGSGENLKMFTSPELLLEYLKDSVVAFESIEQEMDILKAKHLPF